MTTQQHVKLGRQTALISFLLGTCIFGLYFLTSAFALLFIGYGFILLTALINIGILMSIVFKAKEDKENRKKLITTCGVMLLNIPVMLFYCLVAITLLDTMRITFMNSTKAPLKNINIVGCGGGHIDKLEVGESKTVWISITGDCTINIDYIANGEQKKENVVGYTTAHMGQKIKHNIGVQREPPF